MGDTTNQTPAFGSSFKALSIDTNGTVANHTVTLPSPGNATISLKTKSGADIGDFTTN